MNYIIKQEEHTLDLPHLAVSGWYATLCPGVEAYIVVDANHNVLCGFTAHGILLRESSIGPLAFFKECIKPPIKITMQVNRDRVQLYMGAVKTLLCFVSMGWEEWDAYCLHK